MSKHLALSVMGKDRPGIVAIISKVLFETGCNIEDSSMTILESEFAMILIVALGSKTSLIVLRNRLFNACKKAKMTISIRELEKTESKKEKPAKNAYVISVHGADKPGIVYKVSDLLAKNKVNISDVQTMRSGSQNNAAYLMLLETEFPSSNAFEQIKRKLRALSESLDIRITVNAVESPQL